VIYLDSCALMKLVRREAETEALREWLDLRHEQPVITSELGRAEVLRAARRVGDPVLAGARAVVGDLIWVPLDRAVQDAACESEIRTYVPSGLIEPRRPSRTGWGDRDAVAERR